jgi:oligosaccharide reducing-end xylanase
MPVQCVYPGIVTKFVDIKIKDTVQYSYIFVQGGDEYMKKIRSVFAELGYSQTDIERKITDCRRAIFEGPERFYFEGPDDTAYLTDTGNNDVRTEGMSYGMMMALQMNRRDIFDRIWKWSRVYMFMEEGKNRNYFAWSCTLNGEKNSWGPAPDGEEYFAMALFFASARWGDGEGIFNYSREAVALLETCLHQGSRPKDEPGARPMWDADNYLIRFIPDCDFSDPSYHLPHFYDLFAKRAAAGDRPFWKKAAAASRNYIAQACHPATGMAPEYADYDGKPNPEGPPVGHSDFYSDSYRVALNIGLDALWNGPVEPLSLAAAALLEFFANQDSGDLRRYAVDGTARDEPALHPIGLIAANAAAAPAVLGVPGMSKQAEAGAEKAVRLFWNTPPRTGPRRYYDNCLYFFSLLILSGYSKVY